MNKRRLLKILIAATLMTFAVTALYPAYRAWDQRQMVRVTLKWGRLAPFPTAAQNFQIQTDGGPFTRAFRTSFIAPAADIERWLEASPGTKNPLPPEEVEYLRPSSKRRILIRPGGGAQIAEVTIDYTYNRVEIYVAWS